MPGDIPWIIWTILIPLLAAIFTFLFRRLASVIGVSVSVVICIVVGFLIRQVTHQGPIRHSLGGWGSPLGIDLYIDGLSALMLAMTATVGLAVSIYASAYFGRSSRQHDYFWPLWLFLWAGLNALFLSTDLFNLYVTIEVVGLSAVSLAALSASKEALGAAMRYLLVSLLGSMTYLLGVALLYVNHGILDIAQLRDVLQAGPLSWIVMALITVGLLLKTAVFPLHFWLPQAHANAPAPVSAVLSALVVKASFYLLLRLWFNLFDGVVTPLAAQFVGVLGAIAIVWGSILALRQERLKLVVAYSTVALLGYLFVAFPLVLSVGVQAWRGVVYFALSHAIAKTAMFLSAGTLMHAAGHDRFNEMRNTARRMPVTMVTFGLAGISLIGLPPSGGFLAKWTLLESALQSGQWWWAVIILIGGLLAAAYVFRVLSCAFLGVTNERAITSDRRLEWSALALALLAVMLGLFALQPFNLLMIGIPAFTAVPNGGAV